MTDTLIIIYKRKPVNPLTVTDSIYSDVELLFLDNPYLYVNPKFWWCMDHWYLEFSLFVQFTIHDFEVKWNGSKTRSIS